MDWSFFIWVCDQAEAIKWTLGCRGDSIDGIADQALALPFVNGFHPGELRNPSRGIAIKHQNYCSCLCLQPLPKSAEELPVLWKDMEKELLPEVIFKDLLQRIDFGGGEDGNLVEHGHLAAHPGELVRGQQGWVLARHKGKRAGIHLPKDHVQGVNKTGKAELWFVMMGHVE